MGLPKPRRVHFTTLAMAIVSTCLFAQRSAPGGERNAGRAEERPVVSERSMPVSSPEVRPSASERPAPSTRPEAVQSKAPAPRPDEKARMGSKVQAAPVSKLPGTQVQPVPVPVVPSFSPQCTEAPTANYWEKRDLFKEIQMAARQGFLPVTRVEDNLSKFSGSAEFPAGWKAYEFLVPPGGNLHVRLTHPNEAWFRVTMGDRTGAMEKGMSQNLIPTGSPEATYKNPSSHELRAVYVIVDDPGWMSAKNNPYVLNIDRDWAPASVDTKSLATVQGIWASR